MKEEDVKLSPAIVNKQILELKKKIQLSEGQRKATFEDCEAEKKNNADEIHKLKKDIRELVKQLKEIKEATSTFKVSIKKLEAIVGPFSEKRTYEIQELLDLHIIDKSKYLNIIRFKIKKRQILLVELGKEYQTLLSQKSLKEVVEKVDKPAQKAACDLQNSIHAVEVQLREANHITIRYREIKKSLQKDSVRFESNIKNIEEQLAEQNNDISRLQQVTNEATRIRGKARGHLLSEEKIAMDKANLRERQTAEGRRLVNTRKQELEMLEKRIFQIVKTPMHITEVNEDAANANDEDAPETPSQPEDALAEAFEILKHATGTTNSDEVLQRFSSQKDTFQRLVLLRKNYEVEKRNFEKELENLNTELENFKYAEVKENERKSGKLEEIQNLILEEQERSEKANAIKINKDNTLKTILSAVRQIHACINPLAVSGENILMILEQIDNGLQEITKKNIEENMENANQLVIVDGVEEKWLPTPYSGLVRRTPIPQPGASPVPPPAQASEDEEEVPSRTYLKRQAQLVVDAKSRRKNIRIPPPKRN